MTDEPIPDLPPRVLDGVVFERVNFVRGPDDLVAADRDGPVRRGDTPVTDLNEDEITKAADRLVAVADATNAVAAIVLRDYRHTMGLMVLYGAQAVDRYHALVDAGTDSDEAFAQVEAERLREIEERRARRSGSR